MSRTRAEALVLVNWRGVFYERYLLDRHVTALEGANGAGKTTVMIAAYVVLLPDMSRLRFTNLGETGATGGDKGIWGRLGEPGRPSYAALDFALSGPQRLIAGVHLERKGEPSVEPTPFIVTGLAPEIRLQDLMLVVQGTSEVVPELTELRENAARLGGRLQVFSSARDYFAALFEQGVTPLRLGTDEERNKLNEMLRTSMTGGISRVLTSELRSFLLKEESGLADTLQRMKANLDACRRTRTEVQESQRLEQEIGGVFEAGQGMFAAAFHATRERADEYQRRRAEAETLRDAANTALLEAHHAFELACRDLESAEDQRSESEATLGTARERLACLRTALAAAADVERRRHDLVVAAELERSSAEERAAAEGTRNSTRAALRRAQEDHRRAADGLADLQRGLEELHRRAGAHHQVIRRRQEAQALLGIPELPSAELARLSDASRAQLAEVDRERRADERLIADAEVHRAEHGRTLHALRELAGSDVIAEAAHATALDQLQRFRKSLLIAERVPAITRDLEVTRPLAARQARARNRAERLGLALGSSLGASFDPSSGNGFGEPFGDAPAAVMIRGLLDSAELERSRLVESERAARTSAVELERHVEEMHARCRELTDREPAWRDLAARADRLGEAAGIPLEDRADLDRARSVVGESLERVRLRETEQARELERLHDEARELVASGGHFDPELLRLKDQLGADLVAAQFEDVGLEEAGALEARLGPLAQALIVEDPVQAAQAIADRPSSLASVRLVAREHDGEAFAHFDLGSEPKRTDVLVAEGSALRVTRIPAHPSLGRRARERRAAELREEAAQREKALEEERARRRTLERLVEDGEILLAGHALWLAGDPSRELAEVRKHIAESETRAATLRHQAARHAETARPLQARIEALRDLLADAILLDPPDARVREAELLAEREAALAAQREVTRCSAATRIVEEGLESLRRPPLLEAEIGALSRRIETLRLERDRLSGAIEAIEYVAEHLEALDWSDAATKLGQNQALVPALQDQLVRAESTREASEAATDLAETALDEAVGRWHTADGRRRTAQEQLTASEARLRETGVDEPTAEAVQIAQSEVDRIERALRLLMQHLSELAIDRGRRETEHSQAEARARDAEDKLASERREAVPAIERWDRLREQAGAAGLIAGLHSHREGEGAGIRGHVNWIQEAHRQRAILIERLRLAQGGQPLVAEIENASETNDLAFAEIFLELWLAVRDWLRRRLPAQVSEVDDPREALLRLRDQLSSLDERLTRQEDDLRGASEDVARGIDVQIRKAIGQVNRLNKHLVGVRFGSIQGIRVRLHRVERMEQVLRALREGAAQGLLFQEQLPIEEALDEIFRRYAGRGSGGHRLLDYREYVQLQVEIRRSAGTDWEAANPTRLSTGEAIGVGAALMMVVLTEWERDANLLRGKRSSGSLRFLFLDEANRLSHDNLGVLFDLCQTLDLQLLIAAPEVARAEGNTTYRLIRQTTPDGREEVLVSGRRTRAEA